jgi:hypothetical protein
MIDADAVAARTAEQPVDRLTPQLADQVPQGDVDTCERVNHEWAAADVAVRPIDLLPDVLDARRVLAFDQRKERFGQDLGDARVNRLDLAPAGRAVVRLDLDEDDRIDPVGPQGGDFEAGRLVVYLDSGVVVLSDDFGQQGAAGGDGGGGGQAFATILGEPPGFGLWWVICGEPTR